MGSVRSGLETAIDIAETFAGAGARGFVHAREIGGSGEVGVDADEPVVLASVFKIAVALGYARTVAAGRLDPTARTRVTGWDRTGGIGTAGCADDVEMSWRDLARFMLTMSDNAATDVVLREIGLDSVRRVLAELGLHRTTLMGGCAEILATMVAESGCHDLAGLEDGTATLEPAVLWSLSALDASRTTSGTARETTALLDAIWRDRAGPPTACGQVRAMMADQIWPHRLSAGFPDAVRIAGKTGTLPSIRNEVGVVEYPDGGRYAVAVFTRAHRLDVRAPAIDAAIGIAARLAVDRLRNRP